MRKRATSFVLGVLALSGAAAGCTSGDDTEMANPPPAVLSGDAPFPNATFEDWVSYADQLSVFTVLAERDVPPTAEEVESGTGYYNRILTVRIEDTPWRRAGAPRLEGDAAEVVATGFLLRDGEPIPATAEGGLRLEVGQRYIAPLVEVPGRGWGPIVPDAAILVDDQGRATPLNRQLSEAVVSSAGLTAAEIGAVLAATAPDPVAARYADLDPQARYEAVVTEASTETSTPG